MNNSLCMKLNVLFVAMVCVCVPLKAWADFYVAPRGDDTQAGTEAAPFATLARAQVAARTVVAQGLKADLSVIVRGGTY